jgi:hypothetical protein
VIRPLDRPNLGKALRLLYSRYARAKISDEVAKEARAKVSNEFAREARAEVNVVVVSSQALGKVSEGATFSVAR